MVYVRGLLFGGEFFLRVRCVFLFLFLCGHSSLLCISGSGLSIAALRWVVTAHEIFVQFVVKILDFSRGCFWRGANVYACDMDRR